MRIALFTDTYPNDVNGVARTLGLLVQHGTRRGHEFALVTPRVSEENAEYAVEHHQLFGIPAPLYPDLQLARGLDGGAKHMLARFKPDLVHIATESSIGLSARRWAKRTGTPLVTSFHTNFPMYLHEYHLGFLETPVWNYLRWFHRDSLVTLCPSNDTVQELADHAFHPRLRVWSRGVDTDQFGPHWRSEEVRQRLAPGAETIMVYVGRLANEKRVGVLMEAFPRIRAQVGAGTHLVFVGDGPAAGRMRARALEGVHFTGFLRGEALAKAYAAGDLFVFPSDTETFGNVVLEALASGLPAVVVNRGGVKETVIPGRTGLRVEPNDPEAFAEACIRLLRADDLRASLARGALEEARSRSWESIMDGLLQEYSAALAASQGEIGLTELSEVAVAGASRAAQARSPIGSGGGCAPAS